MPDQFDLPILDHTDPSTEINIVMAIDRDGDSAFLAFNLVVSFCMIDPSPPDPKAQGVQIWRVALDQQQGIGLTAEQLVSFLLEPSIGGVFLLVNTWSSSCTLTPLLQTRRLPTYIHYQLETGG